MIFKFTRVASQRELLVRALGHPSSCEDGDNVVISDDIFHRLGGHREDSSDFEEEEEYRDENMVDQGLDWMIWI